MDKLERDNSGSASHTGQVECDSGPAVQETPGQSDRVESQSRSGAAALGSVGETFGGPVRNTGQRQVANLCLPASGADSVADERNVLHMGRPLGVCVPANPTNPHGHQQNKADAVQDDPDRSQLAKQRVVSGWSACPQ